MSLFTEGHKEVIKSIDDSERSQFQKGIGKFFVALKVIFDLVFTIVLLLVALNWLVG